MTEKTPTTATAQPRAKAVHSDPAQCGALESAPLPKAATRRKVEEKSPAEWAYERLILYIQNFESQLDADQEVAMGFAGGQAGVLAIEGVGFFDPDLVTFYGRDEDGHIVPYGLYVMRVEAKFKTSPIYERVNAAVAVLK